MQPTKLTAQEADSLSAIITWLESSPRKQSNIAFTDSPERRLAYLIEESERNARADERKTLLARSVLSEEASKEENRRKISQERLKCVCDKDCCCNCINCRCILKREEMAVTVTCGQCCTEKDDK